MIFVHLLQTLLIGAASNFPAICCSHLLFSPPSSALSEFSPSFVTQDRLKSISQTPRWCHNPRAFQEVVCFCVNSTWVIQAIRVQRGCGTDPKLARMLWADSHSSESQLSSGPLKQITSLIYSRHGLNLHSSSYLAKLQMAIGLMLQGRHVLWLWALRLASQTALCFLAGVSSEHLRDNEKRE